MPGMMEKGPELLGKNRSANGGAKSPAGGGGGSSANGGLHFSEPESGCSSDDEHGDVGMRVGAEYQARIPEFDPGSQAVTGCEAARGLGESSAYGGALAGASGPGVLAALTQPDPPRAQWALPCLDRPPTFPAVSFCSEHILTALPESSRLSCKLAMHRAYL